MQIGFMSYIAINNIANWILLLCIALAQQQ
jgi:hypothetical protein